MFGILNLNKPAGLTSRDALNRVQRHVRPHKVGHAGTLDPIADGVLVVCIGKATKLIDRVQQMPKTYRATFRLGVSSESDDIESELAPFAEGAVAARSDVERAIPSFVGSIEQTPPAFSAVKIGGKRAYKLARQGEQVDMPSRTVMIYRLEILKYEYPVMELLVECGSGTYIRSLGRDLAIALGTRAVMTALTRTAIGPFEVADAVETNRLTPDTITEALLPAAAALPAHRSRVLSASEEEEIANGRFIDARPDDSPDEEIAGLNEQGELVAILKSRGSGKIGSVINFIARN